MKKFGIICSLLICIAYKQTLHAQSAELPFTVTLEEVTYSDWPGLHSFAYGKWDARWIIVCGRTEGLHSFLPPDPFPVTKANHFIWLLDPQTGEQWSKSIYSLPLDIANQLRATNTEYFQRGKYLYVAGGYGKDSISGDKITFPSLIAIDLDMLDDILMNDEDPSPAFRKFDDSLFQVCGGEIEILNDTIYLFGGHVFTGDYTKPASPSFTQEYTNALKKFILEDDGEIISVHDVKTIMDTLLFHRRDLNFEPIIYANEEKGLAAYSGVFQYDSDVPWLHNIYFKNDGSYTEDISFEQKMNNYTCPVMNVFDSSTNNFYATFFGGISQYYFKEEDSTIHQDLNIPFVNDITTLIRYAEDSTKQFVDSVSFDALLGSNAIFDLSEVVEQYDNRVIKLHALNGTYDVGYVYGGIDAALPNFTPSSASNRLFKVQIRYLQPEPISVQDIASAILIFPNPAHAYFTVQNKYNIPIDNIILYNTLGDVIYENNKTVLQGASIQIETGLVMKTGIYFLKLKTVQGAFIKKLIIE